MQDFVKSYKQFTTSYYVTDGFRITAAIMIPIIISACIGNIPMGVVIALGALCINVCDSPGPLHHRVNGMLISIALVFIISLLTGFSANHHWLLATELLIFSFIFSMAGIYGARATSIGIAALLIMILNIDNNYDTKKLLLHSLFILTGGCWYFLWSILLNRLRPYKLAQQAIGDSILSIAKYLEIKASLYSKNVQYDECYTALIERQVKLHTKQDLVREILFKTRSIVKDSTHKGRTLLAIFNDSVDLFEQVMTSQQDYKMLHAKIDNEVLAEFEKTILAIAFELENIGVAMQEGKKSYPDALTEQTIKELEIYFDYYRKESANAANIEEITSLRHVLENIRDIYSSVLIMHRYTAYDPNFTASVKSELDYNKFVSNTQVNPRLFFENLNVHSNIFRHSIRVSLTLFIGYISLKLLPLGHDYWILLTILVILKPAYSLTKKRNMNRLFGTVIGVAVGALLLYLIKSPVILLVIMVVVMAGAYSFIRINYFPAVILMTIYLLISFYLLQVDNFNKLISDRIIDTLIGSALAFLATLLIPPRWEREQMDTLVKNATFANANYFELVSGKIAGEIIDEIQYKLLRKEAYVAMANLSDAFQRMLSEPQNKQQNSVQTYSLVVFNHLLLSHISTLSSYNSYQLKDRTTQFLPVIKNIMTHLKNEQVETPSGEKTLIPTLIKRSELAVAESHTEDERSFLTKVSDQFIYIQKIALDINKLLQKNQPK